MDQHSLVSHIVLFSVPNGFYEFPTRIKRCFSLKRLLVYTFLSEKERFRMSEDSTEINILLCGSAKVGKSSLINAICQQQLAKSSASSDLCTQRLTQYKTEYVENSAVYRTTFWDMPGVDSWNETEVRTRVKELIDKIQPICMIYCASPGSFAKLQHIEWLLSVCAEKQIFCALVCTNMWASSRRQVVLKEFCEIFRKVHQHVFPVQREKIIYYGDYGLCTMVNSELYADEDIGIRKEAEGVDELISAIAKSLSEKNRHAWLHVVHNNQSVWSKINSESGIRAKAVVDGVKFSSRRMRDRILILRFICR